jgi:arylsulfatase
VLQRSRLSFDTAVTVRICSEVAAASYPIYVGEKLWTIIPAGYILKLHLGTFREFPPRQVQAGFNPGELLEHVLKTAASGV